MKEGDPKTLAQLAKQGGISDLAYEQASKLEHILSRIDRDQATLNRLGQPFELHYTRDNSETCWQKVDQHALDARKHIASGLYNDLRDIGEEDLARDLVDQARMERVIFDRDVVTDQNQLTDNPPNDPESTDRPRTR